MIYDSVSMKNFRPKEVRSDGSGGGEVKTPQTLPLNLVPRAFPLKTRLSPPGSATAGGKFFIVRSCPRIGHADIRDIFLSVVNSRWKKMEGEKNALDDMKQLLEKERGKVNRVLLV